MSVTEKSSSGEKYSWFIPNPNAALISSFLFTLFTIAISIVLFVLYAHLSNDPTPDSFAGYSYAIAGTLFMLLAAVAYTRRRRSRKRAIGQLNGSLHWHVGFGIVAIVLLSLHSFGNFNPRTGTYALYSMIALVISGIIGRMLDSVVPKLIVHEVRRALTEQGEDRVEHHTGAIQSIVSYKMTAWDLAYFSPDKIPQELKQNETQDDLALDRQNKPARSEAPTPGVKEHLTKLRSVQKALGREEYYRGIIRYWRVGHVALVLLTIGLTIWHLEYAATLLLPTLF